MSGRPWTLRPWPISGHFATHLSRDPPANIAQMRCGRGVPKQGHPGQPFARRVEDVEKPHFVTFQQRDRDAVAIENAIARQCRQPRSGREDAGEIQRIGSRQRDQRPGLSLAPYLAQFADGLGQSKLLTRKAGDEPAAADVAARFELAVHL